MLVLEKIVLTLVMLAVSLNLTAKQKGAVQQPDEQEKALVQRVYEAQMSGSDSDFYKAHGEFMLYLENHQDWEKYYRTWVNRVIYEVNKKHFHRAYTELHKITDDIKARHNEKYLYLSNMGMGLFYTSRNQP